MTEEKTLLVLSLSPIASDARVLKQVKLFHDKYRVVTCGFGPKPSLSQEHIELDLADFEGRKRRNLLLLRQYKNLYWNNPVIKQAQSKLSGLAPDAVLCNDIDALPLALSLNPKFGVHVDLHEYSPKLYEEILVWKILVGPYYRWIGKKYLHLAASSTTVGQGLAKEYKKVFGISPSVVTNAAPYQDFSATKTNYPIRLVHSGAALRNRGIEKIIQAALDCKAELRLDLFLMPNDEAFLNELKDLVAQSDRVKINAPVAYADLAKLLNQYDAGVHVIPPVNFNNANALPNKIFDYIQARLAVITGPSPEISDIVTKYKLGVVTTGFETGDITKSFDALDPEQINQCKQNSAHSAYELSSQKQIIVWQESIAKLFERTEPKLR